MWHIRCFRGSRMIMKETWREKPCQKDRAETRKEPWTLVMWGGRHDGPALSGFLSHEVNTKPSVVQACDIYSPTRDISSTRCLLTWAFHAIPSNKKNLLVISRAKVMDNGHWVVQILPGVCKPVSCFPNHRHCGVTIVIHSFKKFSVPLLFLVAQSPFLLL